MPFVQAKCPNCGGSLAVDNSKDAAICQFCDTPFIVEKAINNFNITNNIRIENGANIYISNGTVTESKIIVRTGTFKGAPTAYKFDVIGLFDENDTLILSLNINEVKSLKIDRDMTLTAYHLKSNGAKSTIFGADRKSKSNSVKVIAGQTTHLDVKFITGIVLNYLSLSVVDMFI